MTEAFIYIWNDKLNSRIYLGSHKGTPDDGYICSSKPMLEQYEKRPEDFSRVIVAESSWANMRRMEMLMLQKVNADRNPMYYNQANGDEKFYNKGHTEIAKKKMSKSHKGKKLSDEHKQNISTSQKGRKHSEETKQKVSVARKGKKLSEEHKQKLSKAHKGYTHSEETKQKMSLAHKNRIPWNIGIPRSTETKQKISLTLRKFNEALNVHT